MTALSKERWRLISPHLDHALELSHEQRAAWLLALGVEDPALATDVAALLAEHDVLSQEGFLAGEPAPRPEQTSLAGLTIGAYTLRSLLGQGGMGSVWLADRSDGRFEGQAAVKLLNASLIGRDGEGRFKREGSFLARLRHPNIAQLIDAGVSPLGQPYLVLEHVDGERIDRYCDVASLGIESRLRLFLDVLAAVAFAHANLVVHRDLKPANVLVAKDGQVKLLDFGIAKLIEPESGGGTMTVTREGESSLTPAYAAPEQLTGGPITTATDVYALGVVLYLLLTGQHPAGPNTTTPAEWIKAVVDTQAPRPSDAVVTPDGLSREALLEIAARRVANPKKLRRHLQGDLDNIVAKALKKQPGERYPSVESMADDLRRYLDNQPVRARADSFTYRAAKFVRRNRGGVAAAGLVVAAVLAGTAGVAWQAREAGLQRDAARTQLARATATNEFTTYLLSVAAPGGKMFTVGELIEHGEALIDKQFAGDDAMHAEMLVTVGQQYMVSERWDRAIPTLERASALAAGTGDPGLQARASCPLAVVKILNGDRAGAEALISRALAGLPDRPEYALQRAECLTRFSEFGFFTGDGDTMIANASRALALLDRAPFATASKKIDAQAALGYGYYLSRQNRKADDMFAEVMAGLEATGRDRTIAAADVLNNWALVHDRGDVAKSEPMYRQVLELRGSIEGTEKIAPTFLFNYAGVLLQLGRYADAEPYFQATIRSAAARRERRIEFDATMQLAELYLRRGDLPRAEAQLEQVTPFRGEPRFDGLRQAQLAYYTGLLAQARGDAVTARARFRDSMGLFDRSEWKIGMNVAALIELARCEQALGDGTAARSAIGRATTLAESFVEKDGPSYLVGLSLLARGDIERAQGSVDAARASFRAASAHLSKALGADHPATKDAVSKVSS